MKLTSNLIQDKRGFTFNLLKYTFFTLLYLTIVFTVVWIFTSNLVKIDASEERLANVIMTSRILSSESILYSQNGRTYPGMIDADLLRSKSEELFVLDDKLSAKMELKSIGSTEKDIVFINEKWYTRLAPLAVNKFKEKYDKDIHKRYVLVNYDGQLRGSIKRIDYARVT